MTSESQTFQSSGDRREVGTPEIRRQIGKELRTAREVQQMSLEQVAAVTKINIRNLRNLESGDWSFLPQAYVKGFLLNYSEIVGLPQDKLKRQIDGLFKIEDIVAKNIASAAITS